MKKAGVLLILADETRLTLSWSVLERFADLRDVFDIRVIYRHSRFSKLPFPSFDASSILESGAPEKDAALEAWVHESPVDLIFASKRQSLELLPLLNLPFTPLLFQLHPATLKDGETVEGLPLYRDWQGPKAHICTTREAQDAMGCDGFSVPVMPPDIAQAILGLLEGRADYNGAELSRRRAISSPEEAYLETLLKAMRLSPSMTDPRDRIDSFDFSKFGVDKTYIVLITGRCGSTWLTDMLGRIGRCGEPYEFFNEKSAEYFNGFYAADSLGQYFSEVVANNSSGGVFGLEIDPTRFLILSKLIDWRSVFSPERLTVFFLNRMDLVAQAFSFAAAEATGVWHNLEGSVAASEGDMGVSDIAIWNHAAQILSREEQIREILVRNEWHAHWLSYEDLVVDKRTTVLRILAILGVSNHGASQIVTEAEDHVHRIVYTGRESRLAQFYAKYESVVNEVRLARNTMRAGDLAGLLRQGFGLELDVPGYSE